MKTRNTSSMLTKAIVPVRDSLNRWPWRRDLLLIPLVLASFAVATAARAVDPPPDGGYPNQNTAEGEEALFSLDTRGIGFDNTAIGFHALYSSITSFSNTASGSQALQGNTTGSFNTANGWNALSSNTTGDDNTATGADALDSNTTGFDNTADGDDALSSNTTGYGNTASGRDALTDNTEGFYNTANGISALSFNTTGQNNTAGGAGALYSNITASNNTACGFEALHGNTTGSFNVANGVQALYSNTIGISNTADGAYALFSNTTGFNNTANGVNALFYNTTGSENAANGNSALGVNTTGLHNTADGSQALLRNTTGNSNIALGFQAGQNLTTGSSNIHIGNAGLAGDSRKIRIGTQGTQNGAFVAGIYGVTVSRGIGVIVDSTGHLGTTTSSARFKDNIKPMDKASEAIHALKPVTFRYKQELDPDRIPQFGLVAEQVEKVNPDLVARDDQGKPYTVRYEAVNAMLLNEFLKEHRKVESLEKEMKALSTALQKVSNELELMKAAPRVVANDQ